MRKLMYRLHLYLELDTLASFSLFRAGYFSSQYHNNYALLGILTLHVIVSP